MNYDEQDDFDEPEFDDPAYDRPWDEIGKDERMWAMFCHLSSFAHIFGPLIIWLIKREEMPLVDDQGREALNFQISITIYALICVPFMFVLVGIPMLFGNRLKIGTHPLHVRRIGKVGQFVGIVAQVVELRLVSRRADVLEFAFPDHEAGSRGAFVEVLAKHMPFSIGMVKQADTVDRPKDRAHFAGRQVNQWQSGRAHV